MTRAQALAQMNALPGIIASFERETGEYRVTLRFGPLPMGRGAQEWMRARREAVASYSDDKADALATARDMSARWEAMSAQERSHLYHNPA
ncbi:hypothetical protein Ccr2_gp335 [Caulobacter phage Ccr2]|nr:hypothetical protein Ccr2_gp013 [Caulobacter phage Ccr2]ARB14211.1 hypothetical protein Ccr2_gp335 [Caulobacter phage Ccr2]